MNKPLLSKFLTFLIITLLIAVITFTILVVSNFEFVTSIEATPQ